MRWVLLFGGIILLGAAGYAVLGRWLWRRAKALFVEVRQAMDRMEAALATAPAGRQVAESGAGPAGRDTAPAEGVPSKD